jgi:hypothetical protein
MKHETRELLLQIITHRVCSGQKRYKDLFSGKMRKDWLNNEEVFKSILLRIDPGINNNSFHDAYGTCTFNYKGKHYTYLNIYGQEDFWEDWFDVCLLQGKNVYLATYHNDGVIFYEGKLPREYKIFFGKRAYYFTRKYKEFIIRCDRDNYKKLKEFNKNPISEDWCSGPHCKIYLKKVRRKD